MYQNKKCSCGKVTGYANKICRLLALFFSFLVVIACASYDNSFCTVLIVSQLFLITCHGSCVPSLQDQGYHEQCGCLE